MAKIELTFNEDLTRKNGGRWRKKYKHKLFISSQPNTRAGEAEAAKEFVLWKAKIDAEVPKDKPHKEDYEYAIKLRQDMLTWLAVAQDPDPIKTRLLEELKKLETEWAKPKPKPVMDIGVYVDPINYIQMGYGGIEWIERLESVRFYKQSQFNAPKDETLQQQIDAYIDIQRTRATSGQISLKTFKPLQERTVHFQNWLRDNHRTAISSAVVRDYRQHLLKEIGDGKISEHWGSNLAKAANSVILYLARNELCPLPGNLNDPMLRIKVSEKVVEPFTDAELKVVWDNASERTQLYALLMLNCGMLPSDIADLKQSEYNGSHITRRRKKTGKQYAGKTNKVPMVSWLLWDTTKKLLDKHRSADKTLLLTNENGSPLMTKEIREDGKVKEVSNVTSAWQRLQRKMLTRGVIVRPLEQIRKTGSSKLETHDNYSRFVQFFLGHAPTSVAERRYAAPSPATFDNAMIWLGQQFNLMKSP